MPARQPRNLPFASLGPLFMGRDKELDDLRAALAAGKGAAVVGRALHGLGGVGKTRLAIEYALRHEAEYSALLFVRADDPRHARRESRRARRRRGSRPPGEGAPQDAVKIEAALRWLDGPSDLADDPRQRRRRKGRRRGRQADGAAQGRACDRHRARGELSGVVAQARTRRARRGRRDANFSSSARAAIATRRPTTTDKRARDRARTRRPRARARTGGRLYCGRAHRLRALSQAVAREPGEGCSTGSIRR